MQFKGKVIVVGLMREGVSKAGTPWHSQTFVMEETDGRDPMTVAFDVFGDKIALALNEECTIHLASRASSKDDRWFNNLTAWKKDGGFAQGQAPAPAQATQPVQQMPAAIANADPSTDPPF